MGSVHYLSDYREPWITKRRLAEELGVTTRYIEYRMRDGLPSRMLAGRRQYRRSQVESWLRENGHLED